MPSYLDFDSTSKFRNSILSRTLQQPNGPQSFNSSAYSVEKLGDSPNIDTGDVNNDLDKHLSTTKQKNSFHPDEYGVIDTLSETILMDEGGIYPHFTDTVNSYNNFIGIMSLSNYETESKLMRFAIKNIQEDKQGPVLSRITQNLTAATYGRVRLLDALNGNTSTAINLVTGKESLIEKNYKITVANTLPGKTIDFLQTVAGVEFPWSEIPGNYLSNPNDPINYRPEAQTTAGRILQDVTGVLGSLIGIQRRPKLSSKPSDLMIQYMGSGQKDILFDNLRFSKYGPNYTKTAISQQSSKLFNFVDKIGDAINDTLGIGAPAGVAYIGDDRGEDVKFAMGDFNDNVVRSSYFLSLMFDPIQTELFTDEKPMGEGGEIGGKLTWYSSKSKNQLGYGNDEYNLERSQLEQSLSTRYNFRSDSILAKTQELLETMPSDGGAARSHVANSIDQTSRIFREGNKMLSRGSAIKYVDKYGGESGVEYCRVWTKDDPYANMSDTMKRTGNVRKFDSSVMTSPWNLNIGPMSNGQGSFEGSTNMVKAGDGYAAKKYMFSIENLAWKTSNTPGYTVSDLPYCERGPNGGRVMWFPPYDIKVTEQNNARWETNSFLGRPEPIYTYQQTERSGQISFKVVVDHPSILNLLISKVFKGMSDEEADNYINAFFGGCEELDFYSLIRTYTTLTKNDIDNLKNYLNGGADVESIKKYKVDVQDMTEELPDILSGEDVEYTFSLYFNNDFPKIGSNDYSSRTTYSEEYNAYTANVGDVTNPADGTYIKDLEDGLNTLFASSNSPNVINDKNVIFGSSDVTGSTEQITTVKQKIKDAFSYLGSNYERFNTQLTQLKQKISEGSILRAKIEIAPSTSSVADSNYNLKLSIRRGHSVIKDAINKIKANDATIDWNITIPKSDDRSNDFTISMSFKDLGYDNIEGGIDFHVFSTGEEIAGDNLYGGKDGETNVDCHNKEILSNSKLKRTVPITFYCRQATVVLTYTPLIKPVVPNLEKPKVKITSETIEGSVKKPPIDEMKKIIMKTLSECYYFKVMEEDSPAIFKSLKEKLKYFHPSFHSTTPEGLNSRLNFLLQCVRPGDTIPIKGIHDNLDLRARNTSFGPPPICVVRVGDFYHSKVVIRDINIDYDDGVWDMNPEGIGIQPMIANVTLQVNFIGGQGLEKPVERLQNALSSNFFANTEMYDPRAIGTSTIGGKDPKDFFSENLYTKEFLEELQKAGEKQLSPLPEEPEPVSKPEVGYIGGEGTTLDYTSLVKELDVNSKTYFENLNSAYGKVLTTFGPEIHSLVFSSTYKELNTYNLYTSNFQIRSFDMYGVFGKVKSLDNYLTNFKVKLLAAIKTEDISTILGFNFLGDDKKVISNDIIRPLIEELVKDKIDEVSGFKAISDINTSRKKVIRVLDKLNYMTRYYSDGKIEDGQGTKATLTDFTFNSLYPNYSHIIDYYENNSPKFEEKLDTTIDFDNITINTATLSKILSVLIVGNEKTIKDLYKNNKVLNLKDNIYNKVEKKIDSFFKTTKEQNIKTSRWVGVKNENTLSFEIAGTSELTYQIQLEELTKVHSDKLERGDSLNFNRNE